MDNCNKCLYQPICNTYASLGVTDLPASDVTPCELFRNKESIAAVVHGEWKECFLYSRGYEDYYVLVCSCCGKKEEVCCVGAKGLEEKKKEMRYCGRCGAKMDGGGA